MKPLNAKTVSEGEGALDFQCQCQSYLTDPVVRTTWSSAKPSSWRKHCYGRMLVFEGLSFLNAQGPFLPILFVCCEMGQLLQGHSPPCLTIPSIHPSAQGHQVCPSSFWRVRELFLEIWHLWGPGKCFAGFSGAGSVLQGAGWNPPLLALKECISYVLTRVPLEQGPNWVCSKLLWKIKLFRWGEIIKSTCSPLSHVH